MKKLYSHENRMIVFNLRNILEGEGIETRVVNEFAAGGAGDLPTFDTWPELWVEQESDFERARQIVDDIVDGKAASDWVCRHCQEINAAAFRLCWNCGAAYE